MTEDNIVAFIDIGSAETKVFIAEIFPQINIVGVSSGKTDGMSKGEIVNLAALKESVHTVIRDAEEIAGAATQIRRACLAISSMDVGGMQVSGLTSVKSDDAAVSREDMHAARVDAYCRKCPAGRTIVHRLKQSFVLDSAVMENPEGRRGEKLAYDMWLVDAETKYLTELIQIPNNYGMRVEELFLASLASAAAVSTGSENDKNRLVIDIGAGTTDYILYQNGIVRKTGVVPVGGAHITNDISSAMRTSTDRAEWLKKEAGRAFLKDEDINSEIAIMPTESDLAEFTEKVSRYKLNYVISMRVFETFELVKKALGEDANISGVHLTGGTSKLKGIAYVAAEVFNCEVVSAEPNCAFARTFSDPKFSTVVGMADLLRRRRNEAAQSRANNTLRARIAALFTH